MSIEFKLNSYFYNYDLREQWLAYAIELEEQGNLLEAEYALLQASLHEQDMQYFADTALDFADTALAA